MEGRALLWDLDVRSQISQSLGVTFCTATISDGSGRLHGTEGDGDRFLEPGWPSSNPWLCELGQVTPISALVGGGADSTDFNGDFIVRGLKKLICINC